MTNDWVRVLVPGIELHFETMDGFFRFVEKKSYLNVFKTVVHNRNLVVPPIKVGVEDIQAVADILPLTATANEIFAALKARGVAELAKPESVQKMGSEHYRELLTKEPTFGAAIDAADRKKNE